MDSQKVSYDGPNRRRVQRFVCSLAVRYRRGKAWHPATVIDLSANGCRLRLGEDLELRTSLPLRFERPGEGDTPAIELEAAGLVVWTRHEGLSYQAGLRFSAPPAGLEELLDEVSSQ